MNVEKQLEDYQEMHFYSVWSWTHLLFGVCFFIIVNKYSKLSSVNIAIILLTIHTIYEYKDYNITYNVYEKDIAKINKGRKLLRKIINEKNNTSDMKPGGEFHMPPQSFSNSIGDTLFFAFGLFIAHSLKDKVSPKLFKFIVILTTVYWIGVLVTYISVLETGLHNKKYVSEHL
tara:strand:+ start:445 stop:966 length:522 start_codon:yes stop_codon:yes gene_type:complete